MQHFLDILLEIKKKIIIFFAVWQAWCTKGSIKFVGGLKIEKNADMDTWIQFEN